MSNITPDLHAALHHGTYAVRYLTMAYAGEAADAITGTWRNMAVEYMRQSAEAMGFDLVERKAISAPRLEAAE